MQERNEIFGNRRSCGRQTADAIGRSLLASPPKGLAHAAAGGLGSGRFVPMTSVNPPPFDARAHRGNDNYTGGVFARRVLWGLGALLFRWSPRPLYGWRNALLRLFGAKLGRAVRFYPSAEVFYPWNLEAGDYTTVGPRVQLYSLGKITLGPECLISQNVHICAGSHDYTKPNLPLVTPPVTVGRGVWMCADAFVGPGVTVGDYAVLAARAVVVRDVAAGAVVAGNPARAVRHRAGFGPGEGADARA